ncbi:DNA polymerase III, delta subunit [Austwickia chelonae]|uniref:DNA-directed DNA polymerase n=1 Tax=Austwickia chelonae NBRC 105200 TaxID=1184607 RepID=K6V550_9MICO|nr:DNA polymerase III subunit delta [Austwickia chelonae]GAB77333.1 DNA polymerase III delta subunit [Austwickia chelonae NBRC 105200]SEW08017.1 DNA polymerase III, delta subunit [Austwickia chelonae]
MSAIASSSSVPGCVLILGPEELLARRAVSDTLEALREQDPQLDVVRLSAATYEPGQLSVHVSPSLFGGSTAVVIPDVDDAGEDLQKDLLTYLGSPAEHVTLLVGHRGGNRGKKVVDALKKNRARVLEAPAVKSDRDKSDFVMNEFRRQRRKITSDGVRALVEAVGKDLSELASACTQLISDTRGTVDESVVATYHGGKIEATGFRVADAAVAGQQGEALALARHAMSAGVDPVPLVAVLASQLRQLAKVAGAPRGSGAALAKDLGMAPWQIDRARRALSGWDKHGLGVAIQAVAAADHAVKGGGRDPQYAVEHCLVQICQARQG